MLFIVFFVCLQHIYFATTAITGYWKQEHLLNALSDRYYYHRDSVASIS